MPVAVVLLILEMGAVLAIGFEKVRLLQNPINLLESEVIDMDVYHVGLASSLPHFSNAAAIGLVQSVFALVLSSTRSRENSTKPVSGDSLNFLSIRR